MFKRVISITAAAVIFLSQSALVYAAADENEAVVIEEGRTEFSEEVSAAGGEERTDCEDESENENPIELDIVSDNLAEASSEDIIYAVPSNDSLEGDGASAEDPMELQSALNMNLAGKTIVIPAGTYNSKRKYTCTKIGSESSRIKITSDGMAYINMAGSGDYGLVINGSYIDISNITINRAGRCGMIMRGSYNTVTNCVFSNNGNSGFQLSYNSGQARKDWPHDNYIKNCTSFGNYDVYNGGEDADGFAAKLGLGNNNVFDGCIAYCNSDDGWDLFAKDSKYPNGAVTIVNCIAFRNGYVEDSYKAVTPDGDGNGFKLGSDSLQYWYCPNRIKNCIAFENMAHGFTDNNNQAAVEVYNCTSINNGLGDKLKGSSKCNFQFEKERGGINENLLSAYTDIENRTVSVGKDKFNGTLKNSILYHSVDYEKGYRYVKELENVVPNGKYGEQLKDKTGRDTSIDETDFENLEVPDSYETDFHSLWRAEDGSIDLNKTFALKSDSIFKTYGMNGRQPGASLADGEFQYFDTEAKESMELEGNLVKMGYFTVPDSGHVFKPEYYCIGEGDRRFTVLTGEVSFENQSLYSKQIRLGSDDWKTSAKALKFKRAAVVSNGRVVSDALSLKAASKCRVKAYAMRGTQEGQLSLLDKKGNIIKSVALEANSLKAYDFDISQKGEYYFGITSAKGTDYSLFYVQYEDDDTETLTFEFDGNGGTVKGLTKLDVTGFELKGEIPSAQRVNYTFDGWYSDPAGGEKYTENDIAAAPKGIKLYAHFTRKPETEEALSQNEISVNAVKVYDERTAAFVNKDETTVRVRQVCNDTLNVTEYYVKGKLKQLRLQPESTASTNDNVTVTVGAKYYITGNDINLSDRKQELTDFRVLPESVKSLSAQSFGDKEKAKILKLVNAKKGIVSPKAIKVGKTLVDYAFSVKYTGITGKSHIINFVVRNVGLVDNKTVNMQPSENTVIVKLDSIGDNKDGFDTKELISVQWIDSASKKLLKAGEEVSVKNKNAEIAHLKLSEDAACVYVTRCTDAAGKLKLTAVVNGKKYTAAVSFAGR